MSWEEDKQTALCCITDELIQRRTFFFFLSQVPGISGLDQFPGFFPQFHSEKETAKQLCTFTQPSYFQSSTFPSRPVRRVLFKQEEQGRSPQTSQSTIKEANASQGELPFMISASFSVRWAPCHVSKMSVRTVFNRTSTHIFMSR